MVWTKRLSFVGLTPRILPARDLLQNGRYRALGLLRGQEIEAATVLHVVFLQQHLHEMPQRERAELAALYRVPQAYNYVADTGAVPQVPAPMAHGGS